MGRAPLSAGCATFCIAVLLSLWLVAIAQALPSEFKLTATDGAPNDSFAVSVSISGDTAVVGSRLDDDGGSSSGSAYVFVRDALGGWTLQAKLTASDAAVNDLFGCSVSISGDTAVVGSLWDDDGGSDSGSAYVFVRSGTAWTQQAKLTASDAAANDTFGSVVAVSGDTVIVGSQFDSDAGGASGSAYVFVRSGTDWSQQAKLTASDAAADDRFGVSVAVSGDTVVVGSHADDDGGNMAGSAYVFARTGTAWDQQKKLTATDAGANDGFGGSISVSGDTAVVGSYLDDDGGNNSGSAYVFVRDTLGAWTLQAKLTASDAAAGDLFGYSVSIFGDTVVIGSYRDSGAETMSGSAYVFVRSGITWTQQAKLTASDAAASDWFGYSVSLSGDTAVVGSIWGDGEVSDSGAAYVFVRSGTNWTQQAKLTASDGGELDTFGASVAISGDTVVVGTPGDDDGANMSGSAYIFVRSGTDWSEQTKLTASDTAEEDQFGGAVSVSGDTAVVGSIWSDGAVSGSGAAYVFVRSGTDWSEQTKLAAPDGAEFDLFGTSVSVSGNAVVVGSYQDGDGKNAFGSAYVFIRIGTGWSQRAKLAASDAEANDLFGYTVAVSGDTVLAGNPLDDDWGSNSGSAYVYRFPAPSAPSAPSAIADSTTQITWGWSDNSGDEAGFRVWSDPGTNDPATLRTTTVADATSWQQDGLSPNTQHAMQAAATIVLADSDRTGTITAWTFAAVPVMPTVSNPTENSLDLAISTGDGNPAGTEYAIFCTTTSQWVQGEGSLDTAEAWQTSAAWGTITVTGLATETEYTFLARARNGANVETADGPSASGMTMGIVSATAGDWAIYE